MCAHTCTHTHTQVENYPNKFIITELDGDLVHGEMEVEFEMPLGSLSATAALRTQSGTSMVMGVNSIGGLPNCNPLGNVLLLWCYCVANVLLMYC